MSNANMDRKVEGSAKRTSYRPKQDPDSKKKCRTCGGKYPTCGCSKNRTRENRRAVLLAEQLAKEEQSSSAASDVAEQSRRDAEERAIEDARLKEEARRLYVMGKFSQLLGREFQWQAGEPNTAIDRFGNYLWSWLNDNVTERVLYPGAARLDGYRNSGINMSAAIAKTVDWFMKCGTYDAASSEGPVQQRFWNRRQDVIEDGIGVTHYTLVLGKKDDDLEVDMRPITATLKDIKHDWNLVRASISYKNDFGTRYDELDINAELLVNLIGAQAWDRSMSVRMIRDRMNNLARGVHEINVDRYKIAQAIQQNTIMIAVGIVMCQIRDKHYLDFTSGQALKAASLGMVIVPAK